MEEWKDIEGCEGMYQVSNYGKVKSLERTIERMSRWGKLVKVTYPSVELKTYKNNKGYLLVDLYTRRKKDKRTVHKLVAEAFVPNPQNKPCVGHWNCDKNDNRAENLYWCTYPENNNHPITKQKQSESRKGKPQPQLHSEKANEKRRLALIGRSVSEKTKKKISEAKSKPICQCTIDDDLVATYSNSVEAAKLTGFAQASINKHSNGRYFVKHRNKWYDNHMYKGFMWYLKEDYDKKLLEELTS